MTQLPPRPILLIDDSHEDLFLAKRLLARAGITVPIVTVDGGQEAMALLRAVSAAPGGELTPRAVFCDIKMPGYNGFDVLTWVRAQAALTDVPFYMLSGSDLEVDRTRAAALGATDYLVKFPTPDAFARLLGTHAKPE